MKSFYFTLVLMGIFLFSGISFLKNAYADRIDYQKWETILSTYVDGNGLVNYDGLKANRDVLDSFIKSQIESAVIDSLSDNEKKAFWINAYNALTMRLIVDHYPLKFGGIRTINWGKPWSIKMKVADQELSLGDIEHEILRKWDPMDPRIHFAINCASIGCPKLPNTYFDPQRLEEQLDHETRRFINDLQKVQLDKTKNILYHSAIFNWFKEDFLRNHPDKLTYILKYINKSDKEYILSNKDDIKLKELKYDWGLNKR